jgi:uracil-DNA glycosylase family 4
VGPERLVRVMLVGETPAVEECKYGIPFCGRSGRELDRQYLPLADLQRDDCWISNVRKCPLPGFANPNLTQARQCAERHLKLELRYHQPEYLVTLGAVACHALFPECDLDLECGLPRPARLWDWEGIHVPLYHPAAGLHSADFMIPLQENFKSLGQILTGRLVLPEDEYPDPVYGEVESASQLQHLLSEDPCGFGQLLAMDTEVLSLASKQPWCLSFSLHPGTGWMVDATRQDLLAMLGRHLDRFRILFHNALFDLEVLARVGLSIRRFDDSMLRAYHLGNLRQGLKWLAYRLCGMRMRSFEDVVYPHSRLKVREWLERAQAALGRDGCQLPAEEKLPRGKYAGMSQTQAAIRRQADTLLRQAMHQEYMAHKREFRQLPETRAAALVGRLAADMDATPAEGQEPTDPWRRWEGWDEPVQQAIRQRMGASLPQPSIVHVPRPLAIRYACRDADATLRIRPRLIERAVRLRQEVRG